MADKIDQAIEAAAEPLRPIMVAELGLHGGRSAALTLPRDFDSDDLERCLRAMIQVRNVAEQEKKNANSGLVGRSAALTLPRDFDSDDLERCLRAMIQVRNVAEQEKKNANSGLVIARAIPGRPS